MNALLPFRWFVADSGIERLGWVLLHYSVPPLFGWQMLRRLRRTACCLVTVLSVSVLGVRGPGRMDSTLVASETSTGLAATPVNATPTDAAQPAASAGVAVPIAETQRELVATVLNSPIYLDQLFPSEASERQKVLSEPDYQRWLRDYVAYALLSRISGRVLNEYAIREKLSPSDAEIDKSIGEIARAHFPNIERDLTAQQHLGMQMIWLQGSSHEWRTAKALHAKYGGRVAISSFGACMSVEGRNAALKSFADAGAIKFHNACLEKAFWQKTKDKRVLDVTLSPDRVASHFAIAPWERWRRELEQKDAEPSNP